MNLKIQIVHITVDEFSNSYCLYKKSFFREQLFVHIIKTPYIPNYLSFNKNMIKNKKYYWNSALDLYKIYNNKNKIDLITIISKYKSHDKWETIKYFPFIFGSFFDKIKKVSIEFHDIKNFKKDFAEYFF